MKNKTEQNITDKKSPNRRNILAAIFILLFIISALVLSCFNQEPKSDPASEKIIREAAAKQLNKDPNDLTDDDFSQIKELHIGAYIQSKMYITTSNVEISDIMFLEKFKNLQVLSLQAKFPQSAIPKWMSLLAKLGILNLEERFSIDLSPISKLYNLQELRLNNTQVNNLEPIKGLIKLQMLDVGNTQVSDLEPVRGLTNLRELYVFDTPVAHLEPLRGL